MGFMGKNEILIRNFGPIDEARIDLNDKFQIFIGAQASGKSTICRVVYFLQNIRYYNQDLQISSEPFTEKQKNQ